MLTSYHIGMLPSWQVYYLNSFLIDKFPYWLVSIQTSYLFGKWPYWQVSVLTSFPIVKLPYWPVSLADPLPPVCLLDTIPAISQEITDYYSAIITQTRMADVLRECLHWLRHLSTVLRGWTMDPHIHMILLLQYISYLTYDSPTTLPGDRTPAYNVPLVVCFRSWGHLKKNK